MDRDFKYPFCFIITDDEPINISVLSFKRVFPTPYEVSFLSNLQSKTKLLILPADLLVPFLSVSIIPSLYSIHQRILLAPPSKGFPQPSATALAPCGMIFLPDCGSQAPTGLPKIYSLQPAAREDPESRKSHHALPRQNLQTLYPGFKGS